MLLDRSAAPRGRMLQATTSKRCWSLLENHLPCPASPLQETHFILFHPKQIPARPAASPTSSSISSLRKCTPVTAPRSRPSQPALQEQTRTCHGAKPALTRRAEPSPGHPTPAPRAARCGLTAARHARPRPPEQPTTTNSCVSDKGKNSARKQYSVRLFPSAYCK